MCKSIKSIVHPCYSCSSQLLPFCFYFRAVNSMYHFFFWRIGKKEEIVSAILRSNREISSLHTSSPCNWTSMVVYDNLFYIPVSINFLKNAMGKLHLFGFLISAFKQVPNVLNIDFALFIAMFFDFHLFFLFHVVNSSLGFAHLLMQVILLNS